MRMGLREFENANPPRTMVASGQNVNLDDVNSINEVLRRRQRWQPQAIDAIDACPEANYGVEYLAGICSRVTIFAAEVPPEKDASPQRVTDERPIQLVENLGSYVERAELQRDIATQMLITGEPYLIAQKDSDQSENWTVHSIEEVQPDGNTIRVLDAPFDENPTRIDPRNGTWVRMWRRSPRYRSLATSHVKPILDSVEELLGWDAAARAAGRNRLTMAGLLGIPDDCEVPAEEDDPPEYTGSERFVRRIFNAMVTAIKNPSSAAAAVPITFTYPRHDSGKSGVDYIAVERPQDQLLEDRTDRSLRRISQGLNVPVEVISGLGQATHWGGGAIEESTKKEHAEPLLILICNALTIAYFRPRLLKMGVSQEDAKRWLIWYDDSKLVDRPDMGQAADQGAQLLMIGPKAWRRERGFSESDAPTAAEEERMLKILTITRGRIPPGGGDPGINPSDQPKPADPNAPPQQNAPGERTPTDMPPVTNRGKGQQVNQNGSGPVGAGKHLAAQDVLAIRLQTFGDMTVRRALERAGARLRSLANKNQTYKDAIRNVPAEQVAMTLGRETVTKLDKPDAIFAGAFEHVPAFYVDMCVKAWSELSDNAPPRDTIRKGAALFTRKLSERAAELLFEPPGFDPVIDGGVVLQTMMMLEMV